MKPRDAARRAMALTLAFDVLVAGFAMTLAHVQAHLPYLASAPFPVEPWLSATSAFMLCAAAALYLGGIPRQVWRHMGAPDASRLVQVVGLAVLFYLPVMVALNGALVAPLPSLLLAAGLWTLALFSGRMYARWRTTKRPMQIFQRLPKQSQPILLLGDPDSWVTVLRRLEGQKSGRAVRVLGLIELTAHQPGRAVRGVPIMGSLRELGDVIDVLSERYGETPWVALTGPARSPAIMLQVLDVTSTRQAKIMALDHDETAQTLEPVRPADLLARPERKLDKTPVTRRLAGRRVLVTGGGGSVGSELARQVAAENPAELAVLDVSEYNLYQIELELSGRFPALNMSFHLGDIRDKARAASIFKTVRPEVVIHAAALKHVPLMERHSCEALLTNVGGAITVAQAAASSGTDLFVFISTDKAVNPDNVMGASKRLAELALTQIVETSGMTGAMVRFGNVLGSSGSVVPLFEKQIARGGPVTVTDPQATRYFMTIEEASALVLQAAALQTTPRMAGLYVLDMGVPISIGQLAETMIRLKGKVPGTDIQIVTTGLRAGEKLHECLTSEHEAIEATSVEGVLRVVPDPQQGELFRKLLMQMLDAAQRHDTSEALRLLGMLVPEFGADRAASIPRRLA